MATRNAGLCVLEQKRCVRWKPPIGPGSITGRLISSASLQRAEVRKFFRNREIFFRCVIRQAESGMRRLTTGNAGFGMNELLGIAAALILAAFIIIPGLRSFSGDVITRLTSWWTGSVVGKVFPAS